MERAPAQLTNTASELYVASLLSRLGYAVTITFGNTKVIDLMVAHPDGRVVSIDVKGLKNTTNWPLTPKIKSPTHFFVLVSYRNRFQDLASPPDVFVIPSADIPKLLTRWTGRPEVTCVGYTTLKNTAYRDAWHLLFAKPGKRALTPRSTGPARKAAQAG